MTAESSTLKEAIEYARRKGIRAYALEYATARTEAEAAAIRTTLRFCIKLGIQDDPTRHHPAAVCFRCSDGVEVGRPWWAEVRKER